MTLVLVLVAAPGVASALAAKECDMDDSSGNGPCFGIELTFAGPLTLGKAKAGPEAQEAAAKWLAYVEHGCDRCRIEDTSKHQLQRCKASNDPATLRQNDPNANVHEQVEIHNGFRVCVYAGGGRKPWYYDVTYDHQVLEINARPSNVRWLGQLGVDGTLDALWNAASAAGLEPHAYLGGGHLHIDLASGFRSARHLINFMTRIHNLRMVPLSPDLKIGIALNAPPLSMSGPIVRQRYRDFVTKHWNDADVMTTARAIADEVYVRRYHDVYVGGNDPMARENPDNYHVLTGKTYGPDVANRGKYQTLNLHSLHHTLEIRSIAPQRTPWELQIMVQMFAAAIAATPDDKPIDLLDDQELVLRDTDADVTRAFIMSNAGPTQQKRFAKHKATLDDDEATSIANAFVAFVDDKRYVCRLVDYMPAGVRQKVIELCIPVHDLLQE